MRFALYVRGICAGHRWHLDFFIGTIIIFIMYRSLLPFREALFSSVPCLVSAVHE